MSTHLREVEFRFFATTVKWIAVRSGTDTHVPSRCSCTWFVYSENSQILTQDTDHGENDTG